MSLNIPPKSEGDQFFAEECNEIVIAINDLQADTPDLVNRIVVNQANAQSILGGTIDATKEYFLDGVLDMGSVEITVPSGGINIKGYDFNISGLTSTANNYTMFKGVSAGDILWADFLIDVSGTGSKVLDVKANTGVEAFEIARINFNNCTSLGTLEDYRQGLETGTGRFNGTPELTLEGAWSGGYFIDTSIVRFLTDGSYSLYKAGTSFTMQSRFRSNQNIDLNSTVAFFDFSPSNFPNPNTVQLNECLVTRNGVRNASDTTITPNLTQNDLSSLWRDNVGLPNTFIGGEARISLEITTNITSAGVFEDLAGVYVASNLEHFDSPNNGQLRHLGDSPREYKVITTAILDGQQGQEVDLRLVIWDDSEGIFVNGKTVRRVINNLQGGRDVAYYTLIDNIILDQNDYVKLQVANVNNTNDITAELDTEMIVEER